MGPARKDDKEAICLDGLVENASTRETLTWGVILKFNPRVRFEGLSLAGKVCRLEFWRLMRDTKSRSLVPKSEQNESESSEEQG